MNQRTPAALRIIFVIFIFSLLIFHIVSAEPNAARGGAQAQGATPSSLNQQPSSCANPQQCREIDEVWQMIGTNVRNSDEIWDNGWKAFTAVYVPPALPSSAASGATSASGVLPADYCFPVERNSFKANGNLNNWGDD